MDRYPHAKTRLPGCAAALGYVLPIVPRYKTPRPSKLLGAPDSPEPHFDAPVAPR